MHSSCLDCDQDLLRMPFTCTRSSKVADVYINYFVTAMHSFVESTNYNWVDHTWRCTTRNASIKDHKYTTFPHRTDPFVHTPCSPHRIGPFDWSSEYASCLHFHGFINIVLKDIFSLCAYIISPYMHLVSHNMQWYPLFICEHPLHRFPIDWYYVNRFVYMCTHTYRHTHTRTHHTHISTHTCTHRLQ